MRSLAESHFARTASRHAQRLFGDRSDTKEVDAGAVTLVDVRDREFPISATVGRLEQLPADGGSSDERRIVMWDGRRERCVIVTPAEGAPEVTSEWFAEVKRYGRQKFQVDEVDKSGASLRIVLLRMPVSRIQKRGYE